MKILVCQAGETWFFYTLCAVDSEVTILAEGRATGIGSGISALFHSDHLRGDSVQIQAAFPTQREAISAMLEHLMDSLLVSLEDLACVIFALKVPAATAAPATEAAFRTLPLDAVYPLRQLKSMQPHLQLLYGYAGEADPIPALARQAERFLRTSTPLFSKGE